VQLGEIGISIEAKFELFGFQRLLVNKNLLALHGLELTNAKKFQVQLKGQ
jgi:hypothetical protein